MRLISRLLLSLLVLLPLAAARHPANAPPVEGKDYERIARARPVPAAGRQDRGGRGLRLHLPALRPLRAAAGSLGGQAAGRRALHPGAGPFGGAWDAWALAYYAADRSAWPSAATLRVQGPARAGSLPMQNVSADELATFYAGTA
jgi:thiol:disulfide interchange protein DsbA